MISFPPPAACHLGFEPRPYRPARWLRNPHLQTVGGKFLRPAPGHVLRRERWETPDGDFLDLDFAEPPEGPPRLSTDDALHAARAPSPPQPPIVLVLHGLEGSTRRAYVRMAMDEILSRGMIPVGLNFRSCSGEPNRALTFYHSGETGDLRWVVRRLRALYPQRPLGAMGFSLGGNVLLKYLAEEASLATDPARLRTASIHGGVADPLPAGASTVPDAAVVVSVPFDLAAGTRRLEETRMGRVYTHYFLRSLLRKVEAKRERLAEALDMDRLAASRTLREFDDRATAPLHGFSDAWDYYAQSSSGAVLHRVKTPTLVLHGMDDPFLPPEAVPMGVLRENPALLPALAPLGGHVGFMQHRAARPAPFWAEAEGARYLAWLLSVRPGPQAVPGDPSYPFQAEGR
jgi:predicted alpha/beta-fold hydrolase